MLKSNSKDNHKLINLFKIFLKLNIIKMKRSLRIWKKSVTFKSIYQSRSATKQKSNIKNQKQRSASKTNIKENLAENDYKYQKNNKV